MSKEEEKAQKQAEIVDAWLANNEPKSEITITGLDQPPEGLNIEVKEVLTREEKIELVRSLVASMSFEDWVEAHKHIPFVKNMVERDKRIEKALRALDES